MASSSLAVITAMVTPALFILGSASLVATALVRMARVVDRTRQIAAIALQGTQSEHAMTSDELRTSLERHAARARYTERSITLLYASIVVFIATCLSIAADRFVGTSIHGLPEALAITGTLLLLAGASWMVAESRLSSRQITEEIAQAITHLETRQP